MSRYRRGRGNDDALSLVIFLMLIIFLMPIAGLYFLMKQDPSQKVLGGVLLIFGIVLWIVIGVGT